MLRQQVVTALQTRRGCVQSVMSLQQHVVINWTGQMKLSRGNHSVTEYYEESALMELRIYTHTHTHTHTHTWISTKQKGKKFLKQLYRIFSSDLFP